MKPDDKENWGNPQACLNMMDFINFLRANIFWRPRAGWGSSISNVYEPFRDYCPFMSLVLHLNKTVAFGCKPVPLYRVKICSKSSQLVEGNSLRPGWKQLSTGVKLCTSFLLVLYQKTSEHFKRALQKTYYLRRAFNVTTINCIASSNH